MTLSIINANIVTPDEVLANASLVIENGRIAKINPAGASREGGLLDAKGAFLLPGFVDVHSDNIEQMVEPRPGSLIDMSVGILEQEKHLASHGITTMFHSLSMEADSVAEKSRMVRKTEYAAKLVRTIASHQEQYPSLIHHRIHIRFDLCCKNGVEELKKLMSEGLVSLISFVDHSSGRRILRFLEASFAETQASGGGLADLRAGDLPEEMASLAELLDVTALARSKGIPIATHDDESTARIDFVRNGLSASISEFPDDLEVARYARKNGMDTVAGSPNALRGKSLYGRLSAAEGAADGSITILCSDYYPPSMLQAVFKLHQQWGMSLPAAVRLVSAAPARAAGIGDTTGSVEEGKAADLLLVDLAGDLPVLKTVLRDGAVVMTLYHDGAAR